MTEEAAEFWREYSAKLGEEVLRFSLGRYVSGMRDMEGPLWGLVIVTDAGLRFHHFPHENWLASLTRVSGSKEAGKEKTFFIPTARILSSELVKEKSFWKRLFSSVSPRLVVRYRPSDTDTGESTLVAELERDAEELAESLTSVLKK
ncbi:MAG: hypothetical protein WCT14_04490 [Treponemataceae bacterium]